MRRMGAAEFRPPRGWDAGRQSPEQVLDARSLLCDAGGPGFPEVGYRTVDRGFDDRA